MFLPCFMTTGFESLTVWVLRLERLRSSWMDDSNTQNSTRGMNGLSVERTMGMEKKKLEGLAEESTSSCGFRTR